MPRIMMERPGQTTDTDEYYIKHPTGRKLMLEEEAFDTSDGKEVLENMQHIAPHEVPALCVAEERRQIQLERGPSCSGF